jgi:hypothetical protein
MSTQDNDNVEIYAELLTQNVERMRTLKKQQIKNREGKVFFIPTHLKPFPQNRDLVEGTISNHKDIVRRVPTFKCKIEKCG